MAIRAIALTLAGHRPIALEVPAMPAWGRINQQTGMGEILSDTIPNKSEEILGG
jgi:hypothetical protein